MSHSNPPPQNPEDQLADFTDRVLAGKTAALASPSDPELRQLEETALRLSQAFPGRTPDEKTSKHMLADFKSRLRRRDASRPAWQSQQTRRQIGLALAGAAILVSLVILVPFLTTGGGSTQGTAGLQPLNIGLLIGLGVVLILALWLVRRK